MPHDKTSGPATPAAPTPPARPRFLVSSDEVPEEAGRYPDSDEVFSYGRPIGKAAGLERIGVHLERLPPGHRTSYPHAEADEEEFVYVLEGRVEAWVDGHLHAMKAGDLAAFPAGTGIAHTFINNGDQTALLLVGGEASKKNHRVLYPLNPRLEATLGEKAWPGAPARERGPHDGLPDQRRSPPAGERA